MSYSDDPLDPDFQSLADEARRVESRVSRVSVRPAGEFRAVLLIEVENVPPYRVQALADALREHRRMHDLVAEFLVVASRPVRFETDPKMPDGWPPV